MKTGLKFLLLPALCLAAWSCSRVTAVNTTEPTNKMYNKQMIGDKRVIIDDSLNAKVGVVGVNEGATPDGFCRIQVEVANSTTSNYNFRYMFEWFDPSGMLIHNDTPTYSSQRILGGESKMLVALAPNKTAKDFRLKIVGEK